MGRVIDTTDFLGNNMILKSKIPKNMSKDNYYLDMLQKKINYEWDYRYNVVDIEEEIKFGIEKFYQLEVVIQNIYDTRLKKILSDDWKEIIFKDIKHPIELGTRYRFSLYFDKEVDLINKSIWICVNSDKIKPTASVVLRRCDSTLGMQSRDGTSIHHEPCILETDFKTINFYYDETLVVPQAEIYAITQYNDYTKKIKINDRFILGEPDLEDRENNEVYTVKAITKSKSQATYNSKDIRLVYISLDRNAISANDNLLEKVTDNPTYYDNDLGITDDFHIVVKAIDGTEINSRMLLNEIKEFECYLYNNEQKLDEVIDIKADLLSTDNDAYYYELNTDDNSFVILNKKAYGKDKLKIICSIDDIKYSVEPIVKEFFIELGGIT